MTDAAAARLRLAVALSVALALATCSGALEAPRVAAGFLLGCATFALWRPFLARRVEKAPGALPLCPAGAPAADASAGAPQAKPLDMAKADVAASRGDLGAGEGPSHPPAACSQATLPDPDPGGEWGPRPRSSAISAQAGGESAPTLQEGCTMLVVRGLPRKCTQEQLARRLQGIGYRDDVNLVHLPLDLKAARHLGYALLGFRSPAACARFASEFHLARGRALLPDLPCKAVLEIVPSPCKGPGEYCRRLRAVKSMAAMAKARPELMPLLLES